LRPNEAAAAATRLRLSNAQRDHLLAVTAPEPRMAAAMGPRALRAAIHAAGARAARDRLKLAWADDPKRAPAWRDLLHLAETWTPPAFPLTGEDAMAAGLSPGPLLGQALKQVEAWWVDQDFPTDRSSALAELGRVASTLKQS
jgi:poly(A) polymerase